MKKKMKILIPAAVAVFLLWNLFSFLINHTKSEMVQYGVIEDAFSTTLYLFKDEVVIEGTEGGVLQPTAADGERIRKGARIGAVLSSDTDEGALHEFLRIEDRLDRLESGEGDTAYVETVRTDEEITALSKKITEAAARGDMEEVTVLKDSLLIAKDEKSAAGGKKEELVGLLKARQSDLNAKIGSSVKEIVSSRAGTLFLQTDGLEKEMTTAKAEGLTPGELEALQPKIGTMGGGCKILYNDEWRGAVLADAAQVAGMQPGQAVSLRFHECGGESQKVRILEISPEENGKCTVVFTANKAPEGVLENRRMTVDVIISRYEGLKVPKKAIVEEGGKTGVYVQTITERVFKPAEVVYTGEKDAIIKEGENTKLRLYDTVIY